MALYFMMSRNEGVGTRVFGRDCLGESVGTSVLKRETVVDEAAWTVECLILRSTTEEMLEYLYHESGSDPPHNEALEVQSDA